jgi:hypothetical protein
MTNSNLNYHSWRCKDSTATAAELDSLLHAIVNRGQGAYAP